MTRGVRDHRSMKTRDWARAVKLLQAESGSVPTKPLTEAIAAFQNSSLKLSRKALGWHNLQESSKRRYRNVFGKLTDFCDQEDILYLHELTDQTLMQFREQRGEIGTATDTLEVGVLRHFLSYCQRQNWITANPARKIITSKSKPPEVVPYTPAEVVKIIAACDKIGNEPYERLRARAMILTMRFTALRISDVAVLEKSRINNGEIFLRTTKNSAVVKLPVPRELQQAFDCLPVPLGADQDCPHFFWNGKSTRRSCIRQAAVTLAAVFRESKVPGARSHRFRHTLATEMLGQGATFVEVADVLGNTPGVVELHYAKWSVQRQDRITKLMKLVHAEADFSATDLRQTELSSVN